MSTLRDWIRDTLRTADAAALPALYAAVSVSTTRVRRHLREERLAFVDPGARLPRLSEVDRTADHVITQTRGSAATLGAVTGVAGWLGVPPEVLGWVVAQLRLAQRLAIVYGFDPDTDAGQAVVARAVAAGFEVDLPERGLVGMAVTDLASVVPVGVPSVDRVGGQMARAVIWRAFRTALGRFGRLVPVVGSGVSAADNHRVTAEVGARMKAVLRRLADTPRPDAARVVDATEVTPRS